MSLDQVILDLSKGEDEPQGYEAVVEQDAAVPDQELKVSILSFDGGKHIFTAIGWEPRVVPGTPVTALLPQAGDRALVVSSEEGETWCTAWWPAAYD